MSIKYEWTWHVYKGEQTNNLEACRACEAEVPLHDFPTSSDGQIQRSENPRFLCELCASTPAGNAQQYPRQWDSQNRNIMRCTNYSANMILLQLGKWGAPGAVPSMNPNMDYHCAAHSVAERLCAFCTPRPGT